MNMLKKQNQSGAAMLLFAMIMMVVISLITVGFAFLVRNDQRQTLDKTLSSQATYAAESAINRKLKELNSGTETVKTKSDCSNPPANFFGSSYSEIQITCLNWDAEPYVLTVSGIDESPKNIKIKPKAGNVQYFAVKWKMRNATCNAATLWGQYLDTLRAANSCAYLKITMSDQASVYGGRGTVVYSRAQTDNNAVPTNNAGNTYSYAEGNGGTAPAYTSAAYGGQQPNNPSGEIDNTYCQNGWCLIRIKVPAGGTWSSASTGLVSLSSIGGMIDAEISAYTTPLDLANETINFFPSASSTPVLWAPATGRARLIEAQAVIDVTAKANDVIKRVRVAAPIGSSTWVPGFGVLAETICKNYQVNGTSNTAAGPANGTACY